MSLETGYYLYDEDTLEILAQIPTSGIDQAMQEYFTGINLGISGEVIEIQDEVFLPEEITVETIRSARNSLLLSSDWTQLPDTPISNEKRNEFRQYRQFLRDIPQIFHDPSGVVFPTRPSYTPEFQFATGLVENSTVSSGVPWIDDLGISGVLSQEIISTGEGSGVSPFTVTGISSGIINYVDYDTAPYGKNEIYGSFQTGLSGSGSYYYSGQL